MEESLFRNLVRTEAALEELVGGKPSKMMEEAKQPRLDAHARAFLQLSPLALIGTHDRDGCADVSPRGDQPGFAHVIDDRTILIAERLGNRLADSMRNILQTGRVGALFVVPGYGESLRINGRALITADQELLVPLEVAGKIPAVGILILIEEVFVHCARCMLRSELWKPETWPAREAWVSLAQLMMDQQNSDGMTLAEIEALVREDYKTLY